MIPMYAKKRIVTEDGVLICDKGVLSPEDAKKIEEYMRSLKDEAARADVLLAISYRRSQ